MTQGPEQWGVRPEHEPVLPPGPDDVPSSAATPPRPGSGIIKPMPTEGDGPSFEALAMQSVLSRARDNSRFATPEPSDSGAGTGRKLPVRALLVLAVGVLVLGVASGVVWVSINRDTSVDPETVVQVSESAGTKARTPQETVQGYLDALADGDIDEALSYGPEPSEDGRSHALLTPAALNVMPEEARPSDIRVLTDDPLATEVEVTYDLAGETISKPLRLTRLDTGSYQLERTTVAIQLEVTGGDNLPVFVNGVEVDHRVPLEVVPGTYIPSTGRPFVEFLDTAPFSIRSLARDEVTDVLVNPELTEPGRAALLAAAQQSLERCIASSELAPTGCPNAIRAPQPVVPGSVRWEVRNANMWSSFEPMLSPRDQTVAVATVPLDLVVTMDYKDGGNNGGDRVERNVAVSATMLGADTSSVTVSWDG